SAMPPEKRPDTVICATDLAAAAIINCLTQAGIRVPDDIMVTGFDNNKDICETALIPITTVAAPFEEIGRRAASLLLELIDGKEPEETHISVDPEIVYRASTGDKD
ncbi:MAG: substrate-binding domain-containing protein, partial [Lachnospiraceae bacterium]|nr:substrate-binding domain-containing protein [Lachnospiraceae bacterium]